MPNCRETSPLKRSIPSGLAVWGIPIVVVIFRQRYDLADVNLHSLCDGQISQQFGDGNVVVLEICNKDVPIETRSMSEGQKTLAA